MWGRCGADSSALPDERFYQEVLQGARFRVYAHAPLEERGYAAQIYYLRGCAALPFDDTPAIARTGAGRRE